MTAKEENTLNDSTLLTQFVTRFIGALASDNFSDEGSLIKYLEKTPDRRSSDEATVVDYRVSQPLLLSLGFEAKRGHNRIRIIKHVSAPGDRQGAKGESSHTVKT